MRIQILSWLPAVAQVTAFRQGSEVSIIGDTDVPTLKLPWGHYEGHPFPDDDEVRES